MNLGSDRKIGKWFTLLFLDSLITNIKLFVYNEIYRETHFLYLLPNWCLRSRVLNYGHTYTFSRVYSNMNFHWNAVGRIWTTFLFHCVVGTVRLSVTDHHLHHILLIMFVKPVLCSANWNTCCNQHDFNLQRLGKLLVLGVQTALSDMRVIRSKY